ncbi:hypothetical protein BC628DRAFT_1173406 [Trametes gibbosa]|nr:hypothetical protein BC628DRAFT_1173406 [Trametes gibbosa]
MSQPPGFSQHKQNQTQPEFKFRTKPVQERSIWESYAVLPARTRLYVSLGITAFAAIGIYASDKLEEVFPPPSAATPNPPSQAASSASS